MTQTSSAFDYNYSVIEIYPPPLQLWKASSMYGDQAIKYSSETKHLLVRACIVVKKDCIGSHANKINSRNQQVSFATGLGWRKNRKVKAAH